MRIIEKMKEKFKDERFIAKMIVGTILSTGVILTTGGLASCANAVNTNPNNYADDARYIGGTISMVVGTTIGSAGVAGFVDAMKNENEEEIENAEENNEINTANK